ncbi:MAG: hypothetical protein ACYTGP_06170 [Planctomycetota bacterium]|jgi:hypothetical protein
MLHRLRRKLWYISYHSASRTRTAWTVAREWSLAVTLALAPPAMLLSEGLAVRTTSLRQVSGKIYGHAEGPFISVIDDPEVWRRVPDLSDIPPHGEFTAMLTRSDRGWPFASAHAPIDITLELNLYEEVGSRPDARLAPDEPRRVAMTEALRRAGYDEFVERWIASDAGDEPHERGWLASVGSTMVWWLMLLLAANAFIVVARAFAIMIDSHRSDRVAVRLAGGRCATCDYDLRGLEYNERCPECGSLIE